MTSTLRFIPPSALRWNSACLLPWSLLIGMVGLGGCSLKDTNYLSKGESSAAGGKKNSGGTAGDDGQGGGGNPSGGGDGGSSGGGSGGDSTTECSTDEVVCPGSSKCVDLSVGLTSGDSVEQCGSCDVTCSLSNAQKSVCSSGACTPSCRGGFADCNEASLNDGCEASITTVTACGGCGRACSMAGVAVQACTNQKCAPTCIARRADCNQDKGTGADDGCEVDLNTLTRCGANCSDGVACTANQVCNPTGCGAPQGVAEFRIPFTKVDEAMRFADKFTVPPDLTNDSLTIRMHAPGATGGTARIYLGDTDYTFNATTSVPLNTLATKWVDITINVGPVAGNFDPSTLMQLNFDIVSDGTGPWANPTVIYVDSIWSSDGSIKDTFDSAFDPMIKSTQMVVTGSTLTWLNAVP